MQYTVEQKKELMDRAKELRDSGKGYADIAIALGISKSTAHFLLNPEKKYRSKPSRAVARKRSTKPTLLTIKSVDFRQEQANEYADLVLSMARSRKSALVAEIQRLEFLAASYGVTL